MTDKIKEETKINGYNIFRGDRNEIKQGGTAIYLHNNIDGEIITSYSKNKCDMVAIKVKSLNLINIVCYRPPKTKMVDFKPMIDEIKKIFSEMERPDPTIIWTGDFNFPFVKWQECSSGGTTWEYKPEENTMLDEKEQFKYVMELSSNYNLLQLIDKPTRDKNTLDLIFTNEMELFSNCEISKSGLSDHNFIECTTTIKTDKTKDENSNQKNSGLRELNFFSNKIKWDEIINEITNINWKEVLKDKNTHECTETLNKIINEICLKYIPPRGKNSGKRNIPKVRKKLIGRLKMLRRKIRKSNCEKRLEELNEKIVETDKLILEARRV